MHLVCLLIWPPLLVQPSDGFCFYYSLFCCLLRHGKHAKKKKHHTHTWWWTILAQHVHQWAHILLVFRYMCIYRLCPHIETHPHNIFYFLLFFSFEYITIRIQSHSLQRLYKEICMEYCTTIKPTQWAAYTFVFQAKVYAVPRIVGYCCCCCC